MIETIYVGRDCSGKPKWVAAHSNALVMHDMGNGECVKVEEGGPNQENVWMKFRIEDEGARCEVDFFWDEKCKDKGGTKPIFDGTDCLNEDDMSGNSERRLAWEIRSETRHCVKELPEKVDWDASCLTEDLITKASDEEVEWWVTQAAENVPDRACFKECLKESETPWTESKESFEAAFKPGGCAAGCDEGQQAVTRAAAILVNLFDCNYKNSRVMDRDGGPESAVSI